MYTLGSSFQYYWSVDEEVNPMNSGFALVSMFHGTPICGSTPPNPVHCSLQKAPIKGVSGRE